MDYFTKAEVIAAFEAMRNRYVRDQASTHERAGFALATLAPQEAARCEGFVCAYDDLDAAEGRCMSYAEGRTDGTAVCQQFDHACKCGAPYSAHPSPVPSVQRADADVTERPQPAAGMEVVAWSILRAGLDGLWGLYDVAPRVVTSGDVVVPLYAAPPAPREAKAPDAVVVWNATRDGDSIIVSTRDTNIRFGRATPDFVSLHRMLGTRDRATLHVRIVNEPQP